MWFQEFSVQNMFQGILLPQKEKSELKKKKSHFLQFKINLN